MTLTDPVNGTANDATTIANNNAAIKTVVNGNVDTVNLKDPGTGKVYGSTGAGNAAALFPPGYEVAYVETTANTSVTMTTEATSQSVVSAGSVTYDGTPVWVEFFAPRVEKGTSFLILTLWNDATEIGELGICETADQMGGVLKRRVTPTAGAHTLAVKAFVDAGTGTVAAGNGTTTSIVPAFIRVTKV